MFLYFCKCLCMYVHARVCVRECFCICVYVCASKSKPACTNMFRVCVLAVFEYRGIFAIIHTTDRQTERLNESVNGVL